GEVQAVTGIQVSRLLLSRCAIQLAFANIDTGVKRNEILPAEGNSKLATAAFTSHFMPAIVLRSTDIQIIPCLEVDVVLGGYPGTDQINILGCIQVHILPGPDAHWQSCAVHGFFPAFAMATAKTTSGTVERCS